MLEGLPSFHVSRTLVGKKGSDLWMSGAKMGPSPDRISTAVLFNGSQREAGLHYGMFEDLPTAPSNARSSHQSRRQAGSLRISFCSHSHNSLVFGSDAMCFRTYRCHFPGSGTDAVNGRIRRPVRRSDAAKGCRARNDHLERSGNEPCNTGLRQALPVDLFMDRRCTLEVPCRAAERLV